MQEYKHIAEIADTVEQLKSLVEKHAGKVVFSTSFGIEDQVVSDMIFSNKIPISVFTLDTGRLFSETYKVWSETLEKYQVKITAYYPNNEEIEQFVNIEGPNSFYNSVGSRKKCCAIRKVEPLKKALKNAEIWITGLRAEQSQARSNLEFFEKDNSFNLVKFNPLKNWTFKQCQDYVNERNVPYNKLHDNGFVSIGCQPCTRAIEKNEDFRAGRWWWEKSSKECGLHAARTEEPVFKFKKI